MKNILGFLLIFALCPLNSDAQDESLPKDTLVHRMQLRELNILVESGNASSEDFYNRGALNALFRDTATALLDYSTAIRMNKELIPPYLNRGSIYQKQKQYDLAERDFNDAIKFDKSSSFAFNNRGFLYQEMGQIEKAIKDFQHAITLDAKNTLPYMNLVDVYLNQNQQSLVFETINAMVAANPNDPKSYTTRSDIYRDAGQMKQALDDLNTAVEISKNDPNYLIERSKFKDDYIFDDAGAVEDCDMAIQQNPTNAYYYYNRSRPLYDMGDYAAVLENCEKALELSPNYVHPMIMKANVLDMFEQAQEAKQLYRKAISIDPTEYDGYKQLSITEYARGNKVEARKILEEFLNLGYVHPDILERHGKIAAEQKDFKTAYADFNRLVQLYPKDPANYYLRGLVQDSLKNHEEACNDMVQADKLGMLEAHSYLRQHCKSKLSAKLIQIEDMIDEALTFEQVGNYTKAIEVYTKILQLAPDSSSIYHARGIAKRRLENHLEAIEDYKKAIAIHGNRVSYWVSMGVSYSLIDQIDEATKSYEKAIEVNPAYAMSYFNLAGILAQQKKYDRAIELLNTSLLNDPNYVKAMIALGDCYMDIENFDSACQAYQRAEKAGDNSAFGKRIRACGGRN